MTRRTRYMGLLLIMPLLTVTTIFTTVYPANALEKRDYTYLNDNHCTARFNCAGAQICGDHICAPGEWEKLQAKLTAAQLGHQGGRNATQAAVVPSTPTAPSTPTVSSSVCQSVKSILAGAGVSSTVMGKVMADLGCG